MIIKNKTDIIKAVEILNKHEIWSYDVETTGLNWRKDKLIGFGCANPIDYSGFYIIMKEWKNDELVTILTEEEVAPILKILSTKKLLGWNFNFDAAFTLSQTGVNIIDSLYAEVMLMAHLCDENRFEYSLKSISASIFGEDAISEQQDLKESIKINGGTSKEFFKADSEKLAKYGLKDNVLTCMNYNHWYKILEKDNLLEFYNTEVVALCKEVTFWMQYRGIPLDIPLLEKTQQEMCKIMENLEAEIQDHIAPFLGPFNEWYIKTKYPYELNSKFKQKLGSFIAPTLWPKNESGQLSFNKSDLERAKNLTKKELRNGITRPMLENSEFEDIITGKIRCPNYLITKVQLALIKDDGIKYTFNILSKDNLKRLIFGTPNTESLFKEKPLSTTPTGQPQIDDDFLEVIKDKYVWVPLLQRYNSLTKIKSTYVDRFLEEQENGIFYPSFYQHRTTSGRYSGDFQQLPRIKNEEEEPDDVVREFTSRIRNFFIAGPGYKIISADYSSLEVVVFADDAADEPLLNIIRNKEDFYSRLAILGYGLHEYSADKSAPNFLKKHKPELRQAAKFFALGIRYGLGDYKLHKDLGISQEEAKRIVNAYFTSFPNLKKRMDELQNSAKQNGFVRSKAGRIRHLPEVPQIINKWGNCILNGLDLWKEWNDQPEQYAAAKRDARVLNNLLNNALNFPIQSFAASIVNKASIELAKKLKEDGVNAYIAANIHDEIVVISSEKDVDKTCAYMREYMENTTKLLVPLEAEPIAGDRYGEVK